MTNRGQGYEYALPMLIFIGAALISYGVVAYAQTDVPQGPADTAIVAAGITYPVAELGGCANRDACKQYCDDLVHVDACIVFAESKGLMNKEEASRAEKFVKKLRSGDSLGGCTTPESCKAFCDDIKNLDVCVAFAEKEGLTERGFQEAKKIRDALKLGAQLPGGCTSQTSCEAYCDGFEHAEECIAFAEKAGLDMGGPNTGGEPGKARGAAPDAKKLLELVKSGQMPGGCASRTECDAYCEGGQHFEECIAFAEKAGFVNAEEAVKIKKTGGKGPGGCNSDQSCRAFCDKPENQEACFKFAEENGLMSQEELAQAKEGMLRMRQGLENTPPEVKECLKTTVGPTIIEDIQSGKLAPGPQIGERMRECFEKHGGNMDPQEAFKNAPPEVVGCLKEKFGEEVFNKMKSRETAPSPEMADTFRVCFQTAQFKEGVMPFGGMPGGSGRSGEAGSPPNISEFLRSAPQEVVTCFKEKLGGDYEQLQAGTLEPSLEIGEKIKTCFESFRPSIPGEGIAPGGPGDFTPETASCLKTALGEDILEKLKTSPPTPEMQAQMQKCFGAPPQEGTSGGGSMPEPSGNIAPTSGVRPSFSPEIVQCLKQNLSEEQVRALTSGAQPSTESTEAIRKCFQSAAPQNMMQQPVDGMMPPGGRVEQQLPQGYVPPADGTMMPAPYVSPEGQMTPMPYAPTEEETAPPLPPTSFGPQDGLVGLLGTLLAPLIDFLAR